MEEVEEQRSTERVPTGLFLRATVLLSRGMRTLVDDAQTKVCATRGSDEFEAGEEIADFEGGGVWSVGTVGAIVADAGAEIVADGARGGFFGVGGTHGVTPFEDGAVGFEDHSENLAGTHEVGEFTEEGASFVNGIEAASFFFGEAHGFDGDDSEASFMDARKNLALLTTTDGIGLDDCESALK